MAPLTDRARALILSEHGRRLMKFFAVSVISTIVTQGLLFLFYDVIKIPSAMESNVLATAIATVPAYWLNRTWTWGKRGKSHLWKEIAPFWIISFIGLVLSTVAVGVAAHNADAVSHAHIVRKLFVQFANLGTYGLIWVGRYFIFNKYLFKTAPKDEQTGEIEVPGEVEAIVAEEHRIHDGADVSHSAAGAGSQGVADSHSAAGPHAVAGPQAVAGPHAVHDGDVTAGTR